MTIAMIVIMTVTHSITASTTGVRVWTIHAHSESVLKIAGVRAVMVRVVAGVKVAMMNPAAVVADTAAAITDVAATVAAVTVAAEENPKDTVANHLREEVVKAVARVIGAAAGRTNATTTRAKAGT